MDIVQQEERQIVDKCKLYVSNLDNTVSNRKTQSDLREIFSKFGTIIFVNVRRHEKQNHIYAFVKFKTPEQAENAIQNLDDSYFGDSKMKVQYQKIQKYRKEGREVRENTENRQGGEVREGGEQKKQTEEPSKSSRYMNSVACFKCQQLGHFARNCKQPNTNYERKDNYNRQDNRRPRRTEYKRKRSYSEQKEKQKKKRESSSSSSSSSQSSKNNNKKERRQRSASRSSSSSNGSSSP